VFIALHVNHGGQSEYAENFYVSHCKLSELCTSFVYTCSKSFTL